MPSDKRQRQDEGRLQRLEAQRADARKGQRKRQVRNLGILLGGLLLVAGAISLFSGDDEEDTSTTGSTTTSAPDDGTSTTAAESTVVLPGAGASVTGETPCPRADGSAARTTGFEQAPPICIDPAKTYTATVATTEGDIVIELDAGAAPIAVNNFVVLSRYRYYDGVPFHRIVSGFVNQAGDPIGPEPGTGGPGYTIEDEPPADPATAYAPGAVAMAKTPEPDSGGSQFFLVIGDANGSLSGDGTYTVFGKIVEGQDVSEAINALGGPEDKPTKPVVIESITIVEQ